MSREQVVYAKSFFNVSTGVLRPPDGPHSSRLAWFLLHRLGGRVVSETDRAVYARGSNPDTQMWCPTHALKVHPWETSHDDMRHEVGHLIDAINYRGIGSLDHVNWGMYQLDDVSEARACDFEVGMLAACGEDYWKFRSEVLNLPDWWDGELTKQEHEARLARLFLEEARAALSSWETHCLGHVEVRELCPEDFFDWPDLRRLVRFAIDELGVSFKGIGCAYSKSLSSSLKEVGASVWPVGGTGESEVFCSMGTPLLPGSIYIARLEGLRRHIDIDGPVGFAALLAHEISHCFVGENEEECTFFERAMARTLDLGRSTRQQLWNYSPAGSDECRAQDLGFYPVLESYGVLAVPPGKRELRLQLSSRASACSMSSSTSS